MNDKDRENLRKLAVYLSTLETQFPSRRFDMMDYSEDDELSTDWNNCGSIGCALGHASYAVEPKYQGETWTGFSRRLFGIENFTLEWSWIFASNWYKTDNTPTGAAKRIFWFLENGAPGNIWAQIDGDDPLCYT